MHIFEKRSCNQKFTIFKRDEKEFDANFVYIQNKKSGYNKENTMKKITTLMFTAMMMNGFAFADTTVKEKYNEFKEATEEKIEVINEKLEKVGDKMEEMSGEAKEEMEDQYEELVELKDDLKEKLEDAGDVTEEKWEDTKEKISEYTAKLERKVDSAIN